MADGDFRDRWGGPTPFSKRELLEVAVRCGAIYTAILDGEELPYDGARFHATELEADGFFTKVPDVPVLPDVEDLIGWAPTDFGIGAVRGTRR